MNSSFVLSSPAKLRPSIRLSSPLKFRRSSILEDDSLQDISDDAFSMHFDDLVEETKSMQSKLENEMSGSMSSMSFSSLGSSFHSSSTKFLDSVRNMKIRMAKPTFETYDELPEESSGDIAREMQKDDEQDNSGNSTLESDDEYLNNSSTAKIAPGDEAGNIDFNTIPWVGQEYQHVEVNLSPVKQRHVVSDAIPMCPRRLPSLQDSPAIRKKRSAPRDNTPRTPRRNRYVRYRRSNHEVDLTHHVRTSHPRGHRDPEVVLERCRSNRISRRERRKSFTRDNNKEKSKGSYLSNNNQSNNSSGLLRHRPSQIHRGISADATDLGRIGGNASEEFSLTPSPRRSIAKLNGSSSKFGNSWGETSFGRLELKCLGGDTTPQRERVKFNFDPKNIKSVMEEKKADHTAASPFKRGKLTMVKKNPKVLRTSFSAENIITIAGN